MKKRYDEVMAHITVTDEMRRRILKNIESAPLSSRSSKVTRFPRLRRYLPVAACFAAVFLVGVLSIKPVWAGPVEPGSSGSGVLAIPDIQEVSSLSALSDAVGFPVEDAVQLPFQVQDVHYTAYWKSLAEITYTGETDSATFRMEQGTEDVSGDYNSYSNITEASTESGTSVTLKGNENGYVLAVWTDGTYAYSLSLTQAQPEDCWLELLRAF